MLVACGSTLTPVQRHLSCKSQVCRTLLFPFTLRPGQPRLQAALLGCRSMHCQRSGGRPGLERPSSARSAPSDVLLRTRRKPLFSASLTHPSGQGPKLRRNTARIPAKSNRPGLAEKQPTVKSKAERVVSGVITTSNTQTMPEVLPRGVMSKRQLPVRDFCTVAFPDPEWGRHVMRCPTSAKNPCHVAQG